MAVVPINSGDSQRKQILSCVMLVRSGGGDNTVSRLTLLPHFRGRTGAKGSFSTMRQVTVGDVRWPLEPTPRFRCSKRVREGELEGTSAFLAGTKRALYVAGLVSVPRLYLFIFKSRQQSGFLCELS